MPELAEQIRTWLETFGVQLPAAGNRPIPKRPRTEKTPMQLPPLADEEPLPQTQERRQELEEPSPEAEASADCLMSVVGFAVCVVGLSASKPKDRRRNRESSEREASIPQCRGRGERGVSTPR